MSYKIKIEMFEGPLDLLLYLVKKDHLNIYDIPIATVTQQYLDYLNLMQMLDLNVAGEFLVMAATLMQIKSKMLLPVDENAPPEEEEDPRAELVRRLLEYEKYKQVAEQLRQKEEEQRQIYKRPKVEVDLKNIPEEKPAYFEASIFDLINAFSQALKDIPKEMFYEVIKDEFTVEEKTHSLLHLLLVQPQIKLSELFGKAKNKIEIIVTFLSVLELIRMKEIVARQADAFSEIEIVRNADNIVPLTQKEEEKENGREDSGDAVEGTEPSAADPAG